MQNNATVATNPLAVLKPAKSPRRYTLTEYLQREERTDELHEYYNGIITKLPMARGSHNRITMNTGTAFNNAFDKAGKNYFVEGCQQIVYLPELNIGLYPDVLVISETPQYYDTNEILLTNPVIIVEILSKGTGKYDRTSKFDKYKTLASFKEYVLIDQYKCHIETRFREEPNLWRELIFKDMAGDLHLKSVDCTVPMATIYKNITFKK
jgi:Uma2 family endonuclease